MTIQYWPQSNTRTLMAVTCQDGTGVAASAVNLTSVGGGNIALALARKQGATVMPYVTLAGTAVITNATAGQFTYHFAAADVATPGDYVLVITVNFSGPDPWVSMPLNFTIVETK